MFGDNYISTLEITTIFNFPASKRKSCNRLIGEGHGGEKGTGTLNFFGRLIEILAANIKDQKGGKFRQTRYKAVRILDKETLLACAAYVDLNPIRAALAETIEQEIDSAQRRFNAAFKR